MDLPPISFIVFVCWKCVYIALFTCFFVYYLPVSLFIIYLFQCLLIICFIVYVSLFIVYLFHCLLSVYLFHCLLCIFLLLT